jgi:L,D-peptidoglycan transpeptidase YkuD (ErfK/YbiS/YcfS/YnhG family)
MLPPDLPGVEQAVVVTASGRLAAFERGCEPECSPWRTVIGPVLAQVGRNGVVPAERRRQGTGTTPAGTFRITAAFGRAPDPGTAMPYRRIDRDDTWMYDPRRPGTYNRIVNGGRGVGERLWDYRVRYRYALVVDYNLPPRPDVRRGGGIFLHVSIGRPTSGCVAVPRHTMRELLRWLDPAADPHIVISRPRWR